MLLLLWERLSNTQQAQKEQHEYCKLHAKDQYSSVQIMRAKRVVSEKISFQALRANPHTRNKRTVNVFPTHVSCFVYWETTLVVIVANCGRGTSERAAKKFKPMRRLGNDARGFSLLTYSFARLANRCSWKLLRVIGSFHLLLDLLCFCHGFRNSSLFQTLSRDHVKTWWKQQHNSKGPNDIGENLW